MQRLQAYKFELKPNGEQQRNMRRFAGSCRFLFNKALALQKERNEQEEKKLGYAALCRRLTEWKAQEETPWLSDTPSQALQQVLKNLERAYRNFFDQRADFPRFKKKGQSDSFRYPQGFRLDQSNNRIFLPKLGWIRYRNSRDIPGTVKNITVSQSCGKWFVSIQTEREVAHRFRKAMRLASIWALPASPPSRMAHTTRRSTASDATSPAFRSGRMSKFLKILLVPLYP
jgi:putative transposase